MSVCLLLELWSEQATFQSNFFIEFIWIKFDSIMFLQFNASFCFHIEAFLKGQDQVQNYVNMK